jgi:OOP family OmpA-OmpF porin
MRQVLMRYITFIILILISTCLIAQEENIDHYKPTVLKNFGRNAERLQDKYSAIRYYTAYLQRKPTDIKMTYHLGGLEESTRNYAKALEYYTLAFEADNELYIQALYDKGRMLKMLGRYDEARETFDKYLKLGKKTTDRDAKKKATAEMLGCDTASMLMQKPTLVALQHLGNDVNKPHIEFSPIPVSKDEIIYGSLAMDELKYYELTEAKPTRKYYVATRENGKWVNHGELDGPFNTEDVHVGNGAFSPDGQRFYFTRCEENWKNEVVCHLWVSKRNQRGWDEPQKLNELVNPAKYSATQPTVGIESKRKREVVYFVSNRPEGYGGEDIWYTIYDAKKKTYSTPRNAGKSVNTPRDEVTPFYFETERKLFYSSNGRSGLGGFDVYYSRGELKEWTPATNVGYPLNSSADDISYCLTEAGDNGFIVSNRSGGNQLLHATCCDDIYEFYKTNPVHLFVKGTVAQFSGDETQNTNLSYWDIYNKPTVQGAKVDLYITENGKEVFLRSIETDAKGEFLVPLEQHMEYRIRVTKEGYLNNEAQLSTMGYTMSDTLSSNFGLTLTPETALTLQNIEYEYNSAELTPQAKVTIDNYLLKILNINPEIKIELGSHTDDKGSDDYNKKLSQQRAESVVKYLTQKGINPKRLVAKGYGESKPIAPNSNPDGSDNEAGRQKNRRTEFKVIGKIDLPKVAEDED